MSSGSCLERSLLILLPFTAGCESPADDSNRLPEIRMYHDQGSVSIGPPNGDEPTFLGRMERVGQGGSCYFLPHGIRRDLIHSLVAVSLYC